MNRSGVDADLEDLRRRMRHSAAHLLAEAALKLFPEAKLTIGPPTDDGFYYDFDVDRTFTPEDLEKIQELMAESVASDLPFVERQVSREEAADLVKDNRYKLEILEGIPVDEPVTFCSHGDFEDLCRGGHLQSTGEISAFKLLGSSGAYWRGDERNPMLQRINGTAWESGEALERHLELVVEAERRDHRRLGPQLGLFFFDPISPASPFFLPKGATVFNELVSFVRGLYRRYGYQEVITPQMFLSTLFEESGHLEAYRDDMYLLEAHNRHYGVKPMNCPAAAALYRHGLHSYRELPLRYADFGRLHRNERSGVTHGLTRVRSLTQDDAHIFCTEEQIHDEVKGFIEMLTEAYAVFKFERTRFALSLRPDKRIGSEEAWSHAEEILEAVLTAQGIEYERESGEGAFYGPKIDVFVPDALGREWQLGTVQLDFAQPERFGLEYVAEDGSRKRPAMIHRAMLGSLERFMGVLIEHLGGAFPTWLAPVQAVVVPIADRHLEFAESVRTELDDAGVRVEVDGSSDRMNAKIRNAQLQKIPYMLVVGDREQEAGSVAVRLRSGEDLGTMPVAGVKERILQEVSSRS